MHPLFAETIIRANERELERRLGRTQTASGVARPHRRREEPVTLRLARPDDAAALLRLTQLDCRPEPRGSYVLAEIDGEIVAALSLEAGELVGNPFRATAHLRPLLELRAKQLARRRRHRVALWGAIRGWSRA
jgi:hypothetical protein